MRSLRYVATLLPLLLCGCHVVEKAERCGQLAAIMKDAAPEIAATQIEDSPSAKVLRKKARLYGQLADRLDKIGLKHQKAKDEQKMLVLHLRNLEKHLLDAGAAVEAEAALQKRQEKMRARHEKILVEKEKYAKQDKTAEDTEAAPQRAPASQPSPVEKSAPARPSHNPRAFLERGRRRPISGKKAPPPQHFTPNARKYERAKHAAETISRAVEASTRKLEAACR